MYNRYNLSYDSQSKSPSTRVDFSLTHELNQSAAIVLHVVLLHTFEGHLETLIEQQLFYELQKLWMGEQCS